MALPEIRLMQAAIALAGGAELFKSSRAIAHQPTYAQ
jgi:hypothetical protein